MADALLMSLSYSPSTGTWNSILHSSNCALRIACQRLTSRPCMGGDMIVNVRCSGIVLPSCGEGL
jgi:hypothetical protein